MERLRTKSPGLLLREASTAWSQGRFRKRLTKEKGGNLEMKKSVLLGALATTMLVSGVVIGVVVYNLGFRQRAEIEAVSMIRVFFDAAQTQELQQGATIDWGKIGSGIWTLTLYVNNTGNVPVILSFNYNPGQLPGGWVEFWDYDGTALAHHELRTVTITLVVPTYVGAGEYWWDSSITAVPA